MGKKQDCLERIWAHRVNSIERYEILKDKFHGFETDIMYDDSTQSFWVYHPPRPEGDLLSLEEYLQHVDFNTENLWLDTRGIDTSNMHRALNALAYLSDSIRIRYPFIVELYDIPTAKLFAENGFSVTLNVSERLQQRLLTNNALKDSLDSVLQAVHYVSQDFSYVPHLKRFFPNKEILTWRPDFKAFIDTKEIQQLLDDPQVRVVLVSIKSRYYR
jgi:hypothetical protein